METEIETALSLDMPESAVVMHCQDLAHKLLELELKYEVWKLPAQAKRLEAVEARFNALVQALYAQFVAESEASEMEQQAEQEESIDAAPKASAEDLF